MADAKDDDTVDRVVKQPAWVRRKRQMPAVTTGRSIWASCVKSTRRGQSWPWDLHIGRWPLFLERRITVAKGGR
jgi:hypothetical protein